MASSFLPARVGAAALAAWLATGCVAATSRAAEEERAIRGLLLDGARVGASVIAVGERGMIVRSEDSGQTWKSVPCPVIAPLTSISFADDQTGWIVGHDGTVLISRDGGATWSAQATGAPRDTSFLDVAAFDRQRVVAVGAFGTCYSTTDGGQTWQIRKLLEEDLHLNRVTRAEGTRWFIAGESGSLLRLDDFSAEPRRLEPGYEGSFNGILATSDHALLAYGLRGHAYRSDDGGDTWTEVDALPPVLLATALQLRNGAILLAGQARIFLLSRDGGKTFAPWATEVTTGVAELLEAPDGSVLAFGEAGATRLAPPRP